MLYRSVATCRSRGTVSHMTTWRYAATRVSDPRTGEETWEIRELYTEDDNKFSYTTSAVAAAGDSFEELQRDLDRMRGDARLPHLDLTGDTARLVEDAPDSNQRLQE